MKKIKLLLCLALALCLAALPCAVPADETDGGGSSSDQGALDPQPAPATPEPAVTPEPAPATPEPTRRPTSKPRPTPEATPFVSRDPSVTVNPEPVFEPYDFSDRDYLLPIDFSFGTEPKRSAMKGTEFYQDSTITVTLHTGRYANTSYWMAEIKLRDASQLRTYSGNGFDSSGARDGVRMAQMVNAVVAINGDFCNSSERVGKGFVIRQGQLFRNNLDLAGVEGSKMIDVLLIDEDGNFHALYQPEKNTIESTVDGKRILNALCFGPVLVDGGKVVDDYKGADYWIDMATLEGKQRMCICQTGRLSYLVIASGGPYRGDSGMTMRQLAQLAADCGAIVAYNLDGGDSTMLYFNGKKINQSNNLRKLQDIIYFASGEGR